MTKRCFGPRVFIEQRATPLSPLTQKTLTIEATKKSGAVTTMTFLQETIERAELLAAVFKAPLGTVCLEAGWQPGRLAAVLPGHLCPPPPPLAWQPAPPPPCPNDVGPPHRRAAASTTRRRAARRGGSGPSAAPRRQRGGGRAGRGADPPRGFGGPGVWVGK